MNRPQLRLASAVIGGLGCCSLAGLASAAQLATDVEAVIGPGYVPETADERGLWHVADAFERSLSSSNLVFGATELQAFVVRIVERLVGRATPQLRVVLVRDPDFNTTVLPNGLLIVHTGLLARVQDEAELAAVLAHEAAHFLRRHSLVAWRDYEAKSRLTGIATAGYNGFIPRRARGREAQTWVNLAYETDPALALTVFDLSAGMESEADAFGLRLLAEAGYPPAAASDIWRRVLGERAASERGRDPQSARKRQAASYASHLPTPGRLTDLDDTAATLSVAPASRTVAMSGADWTEVVRPYLQTLLEEQVLRNDPGASLFLLETHAARGWTGLLRYLEGEVYRLRNGEGDAARAAAAYAVAVTLPDAPPAAWRAHGYALAKAGRGAEARIAFERYLAMEPTAVDAPMVRFARDQAGP